MGYTYFRFDSKQSDLYHINRWSDSEISDETQVVYGVQLACNRAGYGQRYH